MIILPMLLMGTSIAMVAGFLFYVLLHWGTE